MVRQKEQKLSTAEHTESPEFEGVSHVFSAFSANSVVKKVFDPSLTNTEFKEGLANIYLLIYISIAYDISYPPKNLDFNEYILDKTVLINLKSNLAGLMDRQNVRRIAGGIGSKSQMRIAEIRKFCALNEASSSQMNLSARAYHRLLKLARTIANLAGSETIQPLHLAEALQYRPKLLISG